MAWRLSSYWMWDLSSWTKDQTLSLALEGGFLTTGPPGKSPFSFLKDFFFLSASFKGALPLSLSSIISAENSAVI